MMLDKRGNIQVSIASCHRCYQQECGANERMLETCGTRIFVPISVEAKAVLDETIEVSTAFSSRNAEQNSKYNFDLMGLGLVKGSI